MPTHPLSIPSLTAGDHVQETFLVWDVDQRTTGDGSPYAILTLANSTGRIPTAPFWASDLPKIEGVTKGTVVTVVGDVGEYRGERQLRASSVRPVPKGMTDWSRLLPTVGDVMKWWATLDKWREEMAVGPWRRAVALFYDDPDFRAQYERCPGSTNNHHAALGGLLKHTVEVGAIARSIGKTCGADADLVLAGVLLHDIGKLESYRYDGIFETTDVGSLVGHVVLGTLMLDRRLDEHDEPPVTDEERMLLHHLILSHHGELEYGSPVRPMTLEAEVLHQADLASATTTNLADALRDPANFGEGQSVSKRIWSLDRRLFRLPPGA